MDVRKGSRRINLLGRIAFYLSAAALLLPVMFAIVSHFAFGTVVDLAGSIMPLLALPIFLAAIGVLCLAARWVMEGFSSTNSESATGK